MGAAGSSQNSLERARQQLGPPGSPTSKQLMIQQLHAKKQTKPTLISANSQGQQQQQQQSRYHNKNYKQNNNKNNNSYLLSTSQLIEHQDQARAYELDQWTHPVAGPSPLRLAPSDFGPTHCGQQDSCLHLSSACCQPANPAIASGHHHHHQLATCANKTSGCSRQPPSNRRAPVQTRLHKQQFQCQRELSKKLSESLPSLVLDAWSTSHQAPAPTCCQSPRASRGACCQLPVHSNDTQPTSETPLKLHHQLVYAHPHPQTPPNLIKNSKHHPSAMSRPTPTSHLSHHPHHNQQPHPHPLMRLDHDSCYLGQPPLGGQLVRRPAGSKEQHKLLKRATSLSSLHPINQASPVLINPSCAYHNQARLAPPPSCIKQIQQHPSQPSSRPMLKLKRIGCTQQQQPTSSSHINRYKTKQQQQQYQKQSSHLSQSQAGQPLMPALPRSQSLHELHVQLRPTENGQRMRTTGTLRGPNGANGSIKSADHEQEEESELDLAKPEVVSQSSKKTPAKGHGELKRSVSHSALGQPADQEHRKLEGSGQHSSNEDINELAHFLYQFEQRQKQQQARDEAAQMSGSPQTGSSKSITPSKNDQAKTRNLRENSAKQQQHQHLGSASDSSKSQSSSGKQQQQQQQQQMNFQQSPNSTTSSSGFASSNSVCSSSLDSKRSVASGAAQTGTGSGPAH